MFFITCFSQIERTKLGWPDFGTMRTFGYKNTFEEAKEALNVNACDMRESLYDFALVEEIGPGIHPEVKNRWFFKWDSQRGGFFEEKEPGDIKMVCNFALG